jgi:hypothetical protein
VSTKGSPGRPICPGVFESEPDSAEPLELLPLHGAETNRVSPDKVRISGGTAAGSASRIADAGGDVNMKRAADRPSPTAVRDLVEGQCPPA